MKRTDILLVVGLALFVTELFMGTTFIFYGLLYTKVDMKQAETMLKFIEQNNPAYYENIMKEDDPTYRRKFYQNYTVKGNSLFTMGGLLILFIVINNVFTVLFIKNFEKNETASAQISEEDTESEQTEGEAKKAEGE